nr:hypothetical protein [Oscillospiraceae bacterium]
RKMKELDLTNDDNKRILIDTFVNSIQVFNDKLIISFNNSEGTSEVPLLTEGCSSGSGVGELQNARKHYVFGLFSCLRVGGDLNRCLAIMHKIYIRKCA